MNRVRQLQLMLEFISLSHSSPRIMFSLCREMIWKVTFQVIPSTLRKRVEVKWITPLLLMELLVFPAQIGFFSWIVS